ncbi:alkaline phosphatase family protein [Shewanella sp. SR44-3]|uniref:alkaline phosphatase family protein n=1 Tax=Shewanella sp. SR44-3 TaxID=2760936 RepID=UPI0015FDC0E5|nr:alkaline phosphatase family protein [Shewanella sp. SR44-3]MBB1270958.1 alkaline phosphatase family protein [Shewanella sp. SR44-3]
MTADLALILAGPFLRHCDNDNFTLCWVSREPLTELELTLADKCHALTPEHLQAFALGEKAFYYLLHLKQTDLLASNQAINYQLSAKGYPDLFASVSELTYPAQDANSENGPRFYIKPDISQMLHGSCRNPHHHSDDALKAADTRLSQDLSLEARPSLLMLSGDQVYVDDIAAPMLYAIGQVITLLGLKQEGFEGAKITHSDELDYGFSALYQRHKHLLPHTQYPAKTALWRWYRNHPIFTSSLAENHLVSLGEVIALYLLTWSPELWQCIDIPENPEGMTPANTLRWQKQAAYLAEFAKGLGQVRRLLAHVPTYMMFDDHDVTDDWNLTARWEEATYGHAFSKRIIGNALIGYTLFQGLGNNPDKFKLELLPLMNKLFSQANTLETKTNSHSIDAACAVHSAAEAASENNPAAIASESNAAEKAIESADENVAKSADETAGPQDVLIQALLKFEHWHYSLNTSPKLVVLDTRTRRWRSESNLAKPSGLMDWEALMDLQQELIGQDKVIIVSPAPMFGVKFIEAIQRTATLIGGSLLVDAENWMAHPGAANALLSIFMHRKTPQQFVILSGDVHYSFSYDIRIRFRHGSPHIYQITCSGIKNQFPERLLPCFDKLNGWLYGYFSPLNWFTKRKRMLIRGRRPNGHSSQRLVNRSGLGILTLAENGAPKQISVLHSDLSQTLFEPPRDER